MKSFPPRLGWVLLGALVLETGGILAWRTQRWVRTPSPNPVEHGFEVASASGCFLCHGLGGAKGLPNPGSDDGKVPSWSGGTLMMDAKDPAQVRQWIENGMRDKDKANPKYMREREAMLLKMPAFKGLLPGRDIDALVAYVEAVGEWRTPADPTAAQGLDVADKHGCLGCHGPWGERSAPNPGSFKGVIPPWDGPDFPDLVRSDEEFNQWVENGISDRLKANPAARWFLERQAVWMPAFKGVLKPEEVANLRAYVRWLRDPARRYASEDR